MIYDFEMIEKVYENIVKNVDNARKSIKSPLTLSEKILYSHLSDSLKIENLVQNQSFQMNSFEIYF